MSLNLSQVFVFDATERDEWKYRLVAPWRQIRVEGLRIPAMLLAVCLTDLKIGEVGQSSFPILGRRDLKVCDMNIAYLFDLTF